jgi:hypothetical protein
MLFLRVVVVGGGPNRLAWKNQDSGNDSGLIKPIPGGQRGEQDTRMARRLPLAGKGMLRIIRKRLHPTAQLGLMHTQIVQDLRIRDAPPFD